MKPLTGSVPAGAAKSTRQVVVRFEAGIPGATVTPLNASTTNTPLLFVNRNDKAADTPLCDDGEGYSFTAVKLVGVPAGPTQSWKL
jgi:hypothetical protein